MSQCADFVDYSMAKFTGQQLEAGSTKELIIYTRSAMSLRAIVSTNVLNFPDETPGKGEDLDKALKQFPDIDVQIYTDARSEDHYSIRDLVDLAEVHLGCDIDRLLSIGDKRAYIEAGILQNDTLKDCNRTNICRHQFKTAEDFDQNVL